MGKFKLNIFLLAIISMLFTTINIKAENTITINKATYEVFANGNNLIINTLDGKTYAYEDLGQVGVYEDGIDLVIKDETETPIEITNFYIYGGSADTAVDNTNITIINGTLTSVYGGGKSTNATVNNNTNINIQGGTIKSHVYGGGYQAKVNGTANTSINNATISNHVFGGGEKAEVGFVNLTINNSKLNTNLYGGGYASGSNVTGNVTVNVENNSQINGEVFGGGFNSSVYGNASLNLNSGIIRNAVYGGGSQTDAYVESTTLTFNGVDISVSGSNMKPLIFAGGKYGDVNTTKLVFNDGDYDDVYEAFGGGNFASSHVNNAEVLISGGIGPYIVHGGSHDGTCDNAIVTIENDASVGNILGGNFTNHMSGDVVLNLNGGLVELSIYGSGAKSSVNSATINLNGTKANIIYGAGSAYHGGNADVLNDVKININAGSANTIYGGGNQSTSAKTSTVKGSVYINMTGGVINNNLYGGGKNGIVENDTVITITGGEVKGDVSGNGEVGAVKGNKALNIGSNAIIGSSTTSVNKGVMLNSFTSKTFNVIEDLNVDADVNVKVDSSADVGTVIANNAIINDDKQLTVIHKGLELYYDTNTDEIILGLDKASITGTILNQSNEIISNAVVQVYQNDVLVDEMISDAKGNYYFNLKDLSGEFKINAKADNYIMNSLIVNVESKEDINDQDIKLENYIAVLDILMPVSKIEVNTKLNLLENTTINPDNTTANEVVWTIIDDDKTDATLNKNILESDIPGFITLEVTVVDGIDIGKDYKKEFIIEVYEDVKIPEEPSGSVEDKPEDDDHELEIEATTTPVINVVPTTRPDVEEDVSEEENTIEETPTLDTNFETEENEEIIFINDEKESNEDTPETILSKDEEKSTLSIVNIMCLITSIIMSIIMMFNKKIITVKLLKIIETIILMLAMLLTQNITGEIVLFDSYTIYIFIITIIGISLIINKKREIN